MKNRLFIIILIALCFCLSLFGCGKTQSDQTPDLGISWDSIISGITEEKLARYGLYADMTALSEDVKDFGSVTFCNYDPTEANAFKNVDYQFTAEYGLGFEFENGKTVYYTNPVYSLYFSDNKSDSFYSCIYSDSFEPLSEEGEWFLSERKDELVSSLLADCKEILFGN